MRHTLRRRQLCIAAAFGGLTPVLGLTQTVRFPKLVKIVVPFSAGAANDLFARALAKRLAEKFGSPFVVDNRPGAGGAIGTDAVARAPADGSTLLLTSVTYATNAAVQKNLQYDPVKSFLPVALVARGPMLVMVKNTSRFRTLAQLLDEARDPKTSVVYGSAGPGSIAHMSSEYLNAMAKTSARHVPYKGVSNAVVDLLGGQIDMLITTLASVSGQIQSGSLRALAVTSGQPSKFAPNVPTVSQTVPGYAVEAWWGIFAPAGTSAALVNALNAEIRAAGQSPALREIYAREGTEAGDMTGPEFATFVDQELRKWRALTAERKLEIN